MAGGVGSRFWPVSTQDFPKQFHDMLGTGETLIQNTFRRLANIIPEENIFILTNERYNDLVFEQLPSLTQRQVVLEPEMRNTAPCILYASLKIKKENEDAIMIVAPSDHWIEDQNAFTQNVEEAFNFCSQNDALMTLGITPTFPNTGYGYIEFDNSSEVSIKPVEQFREKPNYETAKSFLSQGNFLWNAGIFMWSVKSIIASFKKNLPEMYQLFSEGIEVLNTPDEQQFITDNYEKSENISIDYGILEKSKNVFLKKAEFDWNDLGTWGALHDKLEKDKDQNAIVNAIPHFNDASGNMIYTALEKLVVIDGIKDYIIIDKEGVLMIYPKEKEQEIKNLLSDIKTRFNNKYN